jgi:H+/Cl- antiporter ClcA
MQLKMMGLSLVMQFFQKDQILNESKRMLSISYWRRRLLFWGGGLAVGLVCVAFAVMCDSINEEFMHYVRGNLHYAYWTLLVTPIGFMAIVFVMRRFFPGSEGSGIPQVIAALHISNVKSRSRLVSIRIAIGKFFLTACGLACGGSIGREGPTIQLAASIMHALGRWGTFNRHDLERGLLLAGGAAGIAAAFNTPLAGIFFAIEELSGSFEKGVSGTILITVVLSGIVAQSLLGNYIYFGSSTAHLDIMSGGWWPILVVAVLGGLLGGLFSSLLINLSALIRPLFSHKPLFVAALMGLAVAVVGIVSNGTTYGSGYDAAKSLLMGDFGLHVPEAYGPLKLLATLLTYLSGIPGGIFAPSLSTGAGFGELFSHLFNDQYHQAIILLGTVAYFSGAIQSPITCFVIVVEMTDNANSNMLLPIMITSIMATAVSKVVCREPLYHTLAKRYMNMIKQIRKVDEGDVE